MNPLLKEISAQDKYLETGSVRDALLSCCDMDAAAFDFLKFQRLKELNEAYMKGESIDGELTRALYDELYAFGSGLKNADFKQAFLGRLEERTKLMEGQPAIDFAVVDMDGKEGRLSDYKGKVLYVDFWTTWCGPCLGEMPHFNELSKKYPDIQFIGVSVDNNTKVWLNKLEGDAGHGNVLELFSPDPLVRTEWDITGIPRFLLIDPEFRIISAVAPWSSDTEAITPLLEKYNK
ncbi:MAG: TlpA disulfide reductase family protein [Odoribacter sp.]